MKGQYPDFIVFSAFSNFFTDGEVKMCWTIKNCNLGKCSVGLETFREKGDSESDAAGHRGGREHQRFMYMNDNIIWRDHSQNPYVDYYLDVDSQSPFADGSHLYFVTNDNRNGSDLSKWVLLNTATLNQNTRNKNCPLCGIYELQDWRDDTFGVNHDYPNTYLRISEPEVQVSIHWHNSLKWCQTTAEQQTTHACEEIYNFPDFSVNDTNWIYTSWVKYVSVKDGYLAPTRTKFVRLDEYRIRQIYAWDDPNFKTQNVGVIWRKTMKKHPEYPI